MAAIPYKSFAKEIAGGARLSEAQFSDGQRTGWTRISYLNGLFLISNELDDIEIADLRSRFIKQPELEREYFKKRTTPELRSTKVSSVKTDSPQLLSWSIDSRILYLQQLRSHLITTEISSKNEDPAESTETFKSLAASTTYRELFSVPGDSGVCLPFAFIKDKGSEPRKISVAYRIKSHPDVSVVLTDATAQAADASVERRSLTPDIEIDEFWSQYEVSRTGKKVDSRWLLNSKREVELDGRKGLSSFVTITRKDDSKDVGFLAIVPGDPTAKGDAPKLTLFVVREANHARAKGVEPIDEKAFLDLAEQIASSVHTQHEQKSDNSNK